MSAPPSSSAPLKGNVASKGHRASSGGPINPRRVYADFVVYGRGYLRNPEALFFSLLFPILLVLLFGAIYSGSSSPSSVTLYVDNLDGNNATTLQFFHLLSAPGAVSIQNVSAPASDFSAYLSDNSDQNGLLIPAGFGEELWNISFNHGYGPPILLQTYDDPFNPSSEAIVAEAVGGALSFYNQGGRAAVAALAPPIGISATNYQPKTIDYEVPGLIGFAILMNPLFSMVTVTTEYRKEKLFKALALTPLTKGEWLLSKIMFNLFMTSAAAAVLVVTGVAVFGAHVLLGPLIIPLVIVGCLLFVSLGMLIGVASRRAETAGIIGNLVTFPMMFLSGSFIPVSVMPAWLQPYARVWPLFYVIDGIQSVSVFNNASRALFDLGLISLMAVIVFVAAVLLFRWKEE
jgi:ABC-2 type transport system permease protein